MKSALAGTLERARSTFATISLGQKVVIGLLLVGLLLGGFFFFRWITTPTQAPLFSNLAVDGRLGDRRRAQRRGVAVHARRRRPDDHGRQGPGLRPAPQMSGKGLPAGQDTGYALLDKQGITTSEFQQQVTYQRALEGELSKTLEALDGVNQAVVHVALPKDEVFVTDQDKPTASVLLDLAPGTQLSGEQIQAVTNLVSSSVQGMDPDQVTVADSTGHVLSAAGTGVTAGAGDARSQVEQEYEDAAGRQRRSRSSTRVVGPGHAEVSVRADVDLTQRQSTSETYTYTQRHPAAVVEHDRPRSTTAAAPRSAASSARRTCPTRRPTPAAAAPPTTRRRRRTTTPWTRRPRRSRPRPGALNRLTVSVVMDSAVAGSLNQHADPVASSATPSAWTPPAATPITVATMPFDTTAAKQAAAELAAASAGRGQRADVVDDQAPAASRPASRWSSSWSGCARAARRRSRRSTSPSSSPTTCSPSSTGCGSPAPARSAAKVDTRAAGARGRRAAEGARGDLHHGQRAPDEVAAMLRGWLSENKA